MKLGFVIGLFIFFFASFATAKMNGNARDLAGKAFVEDRYEDAIQLLQTWVNSQPKDWASLVNLAILQERTNKKILAGINFQKATTITNQKSALIEYARFLYQNNQFSQALPIALKAKNDPFGRGNVVLAKIQLKLGKENEFKDELTQALKLNAKNEEAIDLLMPELLERKDFRTADRLLSTTLSKFPIASALYWNGKFLQAQDRPSAKKYFEQYLKMYPRGKYVESCIKELKLISPASDYKKIADERVKFYRVPTANPIGDRVLKAGQKWHYRVNWNFVNLGRMTVEAVERTILFGRPVWRIRYTITSNPSVPVIAVDDIYESYVDTDFRYTNRYVSITKTNGRYEYSIYEMDIETGRMFIKTCSKEGIYRIEEKDLATDAFDGTSILTWARQMISSNNFGKAVTVVNGEYEYSYILSGFHQEKVISLGVERPSKKFNAQVGYMGIAGLTGKATGWISADSEALPLKALFQIVIGSIDIELEKVE